MSSAAGKDSLIFRKTNTQKGRSIAVTPENSRMKHLAYGRIKLDAEMPNVSFQTADRETGLICLSGNATVKASGQSYELGRYDALYIPRDCSVQITSSDQVDIVECSADVEGTYPLQFVPYEGQKANPAMVFRTGGESSTRDLNILIGKNVEAGRLLAGVTTTLPGHWASWPPHEHAAMLEELYVYYDMPGHAFGVQFVYSDTDVPEFVEVVKDGDAVLMPEGYHPNVSAPNNTISFLWAMAAHREVEDRQFGVVNVQPGFDAAGSGLEASRT